MKCISTGLCTLRTEFRLDLVSNSFDIYAIIVENGLLFLSFALIDRVILTWRSESFFE